MERNEKMTSTLQKVQRSFFLFIFLLSSPISAPAKMIRFDVHNSKKHEFSYSDACSSLGPNQTTLINYLDINRLGCMGKTLTVSEFCKLKFGDDPAFMRGFIDPKKAQVICQSGERIWVQWDCQENEFASNASYCGKSIDGCQEIKNLLAKNLTLFHHSLTSTYQNGKKTLSCHFISKNFISIPTNP